MASLVLFMSCEQYDNDGTEPILDEKISGEELFKSIIFADGNLTADIPSLQSVSQVEKMTSKEIIEFRAFQEEIISFLKSENSNYFEDFRDVMYSRNPEIISKAITKSAKDIMPLINSKLAPMDLTVEKIATDKELDFEKMRSKGLEMEQACGVVVVVALAVAVAAAVIWVVVISAVAVYGAQQVEQATLTQEAISIQLAEELVLSDSNGPLILQDFPIPSN